MTGESTALAPFPRMSWKRRPFPQRAVIAQDMDRLAAAGQAFIIRVIAWRAIVCTRGMPTD